jgi:hypothetical protein
MGARDGKRFFRSSKYGVAGCPGTDVINFLKMFLQKMAENGEKMALLTKNKVSYAEM